MGTTPHNSFINLLSDIYSVCVFVCCLCVSFNSCSSSCILCIIFMLPRLLVTICVNVCFLI